MGKLIGAALIGVVIGAAITEIIHEQHPRLLKTLGEKVKSGLRAVKASFEEGYQATAAVSDPVQAE